MNTQSKEKRKNSLFSNRATQAYLWFVEGPRLMTRSDLEGLPESQKRWS